MMFQKIKAMIALIAGLIMAISLTFAQDDVKRQVAKIEVEGIYGTESGAGVILGQENQKLFIGTAYHVIKEADESNSTIEVSLFRGSPQKAEIYKKNINADFAVIAIPVPELFNTSFIKSLKISSESVKENQEITTIGHPNGQEWDINRADKIRGINEIDIKNFTITPIGIAAGSSGGPVLNEKSSSVLGIVLNVSQIEANCLSSSFIIKQCERWGAPLNLFLKGIKVNWFMASAITGGTLLTSSAVSKYALSKPPYKDYETGCANGACDSTLYNTANNWHHIAVVTLYSGVTMAATAVILGIRKKRREVQLDNGETAFRKRERTLFTPSVGYHPNTTGGMQVGFDLRF